MIASYNELANKLTVAQAQVKAGDKKAAKKVRQLQQQLQQMDSEAPRFTGLTRHDSPSH